MSNPHVRTIRRAGVAAVLAAALALSVTACGSDDGKGKDDTPKTSSAPSKAEETNAGGETVPDTSTVLVTSKNDEGVDLVVNSAKRDEGGFLTVSGQFKNTGTGSFTTPIAWNGQETAVARNGRSLAGMMLVDSQEKKRYYVLRDTDNRPLTTTGYNPIFKAGTTITFFAQFPAPPQSTSKVDLQFPGFPNTPIEIS